MNREAKRAGVFDTHKAVHGGLWASRTLRRRKKFTTSELNFHGPIFWVQNGGFAGGWHVHWKMFQNMAFFFALRFVTPLSSCFGTMFLKLASFYHTTTWSKITAHLVTWQYHEIWDCAPITRSHSLFMNYWQNDGHFTGLNVMKYNFLLVPKFSMFRSYVAVKEIWSSLKCWWIHKYLIEKGWEGRKPFPTFTKANIWEAPNIWEYMYTHIREAPNPALCSSILCLFFLSIVMDVLPIALHWLWQCNPNLWLVGLP